MDRGQIKLYKKVSASTVLENVMAMTIIILVLGIALMIFSNVTRSSLSAKRLRGQAVLDQAIIVLEHSPDTFNADSLAPDHWKLLQEVQPYGGESRLSQVQLALLDENQDTVAQLRKVIIVTNQKQEGAGQP